MKKRLICVLLALLLIASLAVGCAKQETATEPSTQPAAESSTEAAADAAESTEAATPVKVAVVANQRFGDNGPMDNMKAGVESMVAKHGIEAKYLESSAETFEEDVRAMAKAGYNLIITTFPYMSEATVTVAKEYPDTMFCAIYQFINLGDNSVANIWDTEYHGEGAFYIAGWLAGKATMSNVIGFHQGGEEPSPNAEGNAFMRGALAANPDVKVEFACINSYEDTATTYEYTMAMIDKGADIIQGDSGGSNAGMVDAAKERGGVLVGNEITDFYDTYPEFNGIIGIGFGANAIQAIEAYIAGTYPGGEHGIMDLANNGYFMDWASYERFADSSSVFAAAYKANLDEAKAMAEKIISGEMVIDFDTEYPNFDRVKNG